ncbi:MAG: ABC transporter ATP-binding protein [Arthrobacter sp.]|jgi:iron complex transport system ATP-binding protein|nr:ABC transporter ATP-binding protein [Arthrobacter sp.]
MSPTPAPLSPAPQLSVHDLELGYSAAGPRIVRGVSTSFAPGEFTAIIGPNGCGKSTLLRALARLLPPRSGEVRLDGAQTESLRPKDYARKVALLAQESGAPSGITVAQLVARGRFPHHGWLQRFGAEDEEIVRGALEETGVLGLSTQRVSELSGGQRQRVRVATTLAQSTPVLLLDEPTTFLDVAHQVDLLDLFAARRDAGSTVVAVLHDLNQAMRYADRIVVMREGIIVAQGDPAEVVTPELLLHVFSVRAQVHQDPVTGGPMMVTVPRASTTVRA